MIQRNFYLTNQQKKTYLNSKQSFLKENSEKQVNKQMLMTVPVQLPSMVPRVENSVYAL